MWGSLTEPLKRLSFCGSFILLNHYSSPAPGLGHATLFFVGRSIVDRRHHVIPSYDRWACVDGFDSISFGINNSTWAMARDSKIEQSSKITLTGFIENRTIGFWYKIQFSKFEKKPKNRAIFRFIDRFLAGFLFNF
jgi:hypothetical protein